MSSKYFLFALLVTALAAIPASAYVINYGQDGLPGGVGENADTPLFYDNFESQPAAAVSHSGVPNYDTQCDPVGPVLYGGYWANQDLEGSDDAGDQLRRRLLSRRLRGQ